MHNTDAFMKGKDRAKEVRGRLFAYDRLEPAKTALVVVDMQNVFVEEGQLVEVPEARDIVPNINALAAACRAAGMTIVWIQHTLDKDAEQGWPVWFRFAMTPEDKARFKAAMAPGTDGHKLYPDLDVRDGDLTVYKRRYSAFVQGSSVLDIELRQRGIDSVIITGTLTNVCCESTARDAYFLNYNVLFASDGTACLSDEEHNATLLAMHNFFGDVRSTQEIVEALKNNEHRFAAE